MKGRSTKLVRDTVRVTTAVRRPRRRSGGGERQRVETGIQLNSIVAIFVKIRQFSLVHHVRTRIWDKSLQAKGWLISGRYRTAKTVNSHHRTPEITNAIHCQNFGLLSLFAENSHLLKTGLVTRCLSSWRCLTAAKESCRRTDSGARRKGV